MSSLFPTHFVGEIVHVGFNWDIPDYVPCDGRLLPINQNQALFSTLGIRFGGNGTTNFAVPDLNRSAPKETMYLICVSNGIYPTKK